MHAFLKKPRLLKTDFFQDNLPFNPVEADSRSTK
jgi:hypothetical protein